MTTVRKEKIVPELSSNALEVLKKRYLRKDATGQVVETPEELCWRVATALAEPERRYGADDSVIAALTWDFYRLMAQLEFLPNSPTLMNAGTDAGTLSACFVLPIEDSMESIMKAAHDAAMVQKFGGGTGFPLSSLRPRGTPISTTHGKACGPVAVLRHLCSVSQLVTQGGRRDGANMAVMAVTHPDILEFIDCKRTEGEIHNFNISVGVSDDFMRRAGRDEDYDLLDPGTGEVWGQLSAREVLTRLVENAWFNGEPGMVFLDRINRDNPVPQLGQITATNPCGEQPLLGYESCNLGSINLAKMVKPRSEASIQDSQVEIDWEKLGQTVKTCVRFLDNVIDANRYSVPEIEQMTRQTRKSGLGVMGFADLLVLLRIPYDSEEGIETGRRLMRFICERADEASIELAKERGPFPAYEGSSLQAQAIPPIRNSWRLTVAPTGTISMIAGCSSGIEPLFALAFRKHNILEGQTLYYVDPHFEAVARAGGFYSEELMEFLSNGGSIQERQDIPQWAREVFVTSPSISPERHVQMQAAFQESVDSAISKTINFPNSATVEDVYTAYVQAWKLGCKGITVYRAGSRQAEVLTAGLKEKSQAMEEEEVVRRPRKRPQVMQGLTERVRTGHGNLYVSINYDEAGNPFEVFSTLGKAGGCDSAQLEAISRLTSLALRSGISPEQIIEQLRGITCCPIWDGGVQIRSTPDGVALALGKHMQVETGAKGQEEAQVKNVVALQPRMALGTVEGNGHATRASQAPCPECGGRLVFQEGCLMCHECGFNKCG